MRQLTLLSAAVFVGLIAIITAESSLARSASGVFRVKENKNAFLKPVVQAKRESPLVRSGVRTVRSGIIDNSRKRRSRRTRSGDQVTLDSSAHPGISNDDFLNSSAAEEPEIVVVSGSEEWQDEVVQTHQTHPPMQNNSPQRNTNSLFDRGVKENDMGLMIRYVQPRFTGDKSASYYNHEETDEAAPQNHVRLLYDSPQPYSPYSGHTRYYMKYRYGDEGSENYLPYFRFAPSVNPQVEKETTTFDSPHNSVPVSYGHRGTLMEPRVDLQGGMLMSGQLNPQVEKETTNFDSPHYSVPVSYGHRGTLMDPRVDLQGGMLMPGQLSDFLPPIRTEAALQGRSNEMELGSARSNEKDMKSMRELEEYDSIKEGANVGMEDVRYAEDSVEGQDSLEEAPAVSWYPALVSVA